MLAVFGSQTEALFQGPGFSAKRLFLMMPAARRYFGASPDYGFFHLLTGPW